MTRFPTRVWATIRRHHLLTHGDRVAVAVSGGADSLALLHVLADLVPRAGARLVGLVHVHHGLRGADADRDAEFCQELADATGLPLQLLHVDVATEAARRHWSTERTAHALRHAAFHLAGRRLLATRIALGHTRDDQAETVILRLLRGAGSRGMAGMWPSRGLLVRPLLEVTRRDVEHYLAVRGLTWRDDASNADQSIPRNAVRHTVLPALIAVAGAGLPERLARQAAAWRDDEEWLARCVASELPSVLVPDAGGGWQLDLGRLDAVPPPLRRRVRLGVLQQVLPAGTASLHLVDALERLERLRADGVGQLGHWAVRRVGVRLTFTGARDSPVALPAALPDRVLDVPGCLELSESGLHIDASVLRRDRWEVDARARTPGVSVAALDADRVGQTLVIRGRRRGDRMRPSGATGSQKLQDLMVNRKVPRQRRDAIPVVTTADGQIAWVVGLAIGGEFAIQPGTTGVLLLQATRSGGKA
ncbi:MAG: tRNA lysidine(34) synthetase TilS [Acidobacteria bacterium]|nr:tRNA lysidine(34) synthetase TilS [Acidobacteriota bacterium]